MPQITNFLRICKRACDTMNPFIKEVYKINVAALSGTGSGVSKVKPDKTAFTIADGIVQYLLAEILFFESKHPNFLKDIVGEEKNQVNIAVSPYSVDDLQVPVALNEIIDKTAQELRIVAADMKALLEDNQEFFSNLSLFIDPIDGTKQFVKGQGEMCSVMIGVVRDDHPVGGIIYRPLTAEPTYGLGCREENLFEMVVDDPEPILKQFNILKVTKNTKIMLRSGSSKSDFLDALRDNLGAEQVRVSGAGNKILKLMELADRTEGSIYYIQDRGISRWDSCAGEAVLDAYGGGFYKLSSMVEFDENSKLDNMRYHYRKVEEGGSIEEDIDLSINIRISNTNTTDISIWKKEQVQYFTEETKKYLPPYSNLCGLFAIVNKSTETLLNLQQHIVEAIKVSPPDYT